MGNTIRSDSFTVGPVALAYVNSQSTCLTEPRKNDRGQDVWGCSLVFNQDVQQQISAVVDQIGRQAFPAEWDNPQARLNRPIHESAQTKPQLVPAGQFYCNASTRFQLPIVDSQQKPIIQSQINPATGHPPVYDGVLAYVSVSVYSYDDKQRGVSVGLGAVMVWKEGPELNLGGIDLASAFAGVPAAPAQQYPQQQPPAQQYPQQPAPAQQPPAQGQQPFPWETNNT